jgi:hypothetical protein
LSLGDSCRFSPAAGKRIRVPLASTSKCRNAAQESKRQIQLFMAFNQTVAAIAGKHCDKRSLP